jgi:hypothetical protein
MFPRKEEPEMLLFEALMCGDSSRAIEASEKRGQTRLVNSEVLPKKCNGCTRQQLEKMGIIFGADADDLFVYVTLPEGWSKKATDHDMWSKLLDNKGRECASIFYKAAFYDRDAHISLNRRYSFRTEPINGYNSDTYKEDRYHGIVKDGETVIWETESIEPQPRDNRELSLKWYDKEGELKKQCREYLDKTYPDWQNELAYWD